MEGCRTLSPPPILDKPVIFNGIVFPTLRIFMCRARIKSELKLLIKNVKKGLWCGPFDSLGWIHVSTHHYLSSFLSSCDQSQSS